MDDQADPCRCGVCCTAFLIEATAADAQAEPHIAELAAPVPDGDGYALNQGATAGSPCIFLGVDGDGVASCGIYATRPAVCRAFDCHGAGGERLVELGYLRRAA